MNINKKSYLIDIIKYHNPNDRFCYLMCTIPKMQCPLYRKGCCDEYTKDMRLATEKTYPAAVEMFLKEFGEEELFELLL